MTIAIVICGAILVLLYALSFLALFREYGRLPTDQAAAFVGMAIVFVSWLWTVGFAFLVLVGLSPATLAMWVMGFTAVLAPVVGLAISFLVKRATEGVAMLGALVGGSAGVVLFVLALIK